MALVYNWWSLFSRLSIPNKHAEAITSRPLLLQAVGRKTTHGNQTTLTVTSLHAQATAIQSAMQSVAAFLVQVRATAEQLIPLQRWRLILQSVVRAFPLKSALGTPPFEFKMA